MYTKLFRAQPEDGCIRGTETCCFYNYLTVFNCTYLKKLHLPENLYIHSIDHAMILFDGVSVGNGINL